MNKKLEEATVSVGVSLIMWAILITVSFVMTYYAAYVLRTFWGWFVVPAGYQPLSISLSVGILLIFQLLRAKMETSTNKSDKPSYYEGFRQLAFFGVYFTMALGSGAIWKFWLL